MDMIVGWGGEEYILFDTDIVIGDSSSIIEYKAWSYINSDSEDRYDYDERHDDPSTARMNLIEWYEFIK